MFGCFSEHLSDLTTSVLYKPTPTEKEVSHKTPSSEENRPASAAGSSETTYSLAHVGSATPLSPTIELTELLADVAGTVREKSRSTSTVNLCYSVNRNSKQVYINLLPAKK